MKKFTTFLLSFLIYVEAIAVFTTADLFHPDEDPLMEEKVALFDGIKTVSALSSTNYYDVSMVSDVVKRAEELEGQYIALDDYNRANELRNKLINPLKNVINAGDAFSDCHGKDENYLKTFQRKMLYGLDQESSCGNEGLDYFTSIEEWAKKTGEDIERMNIDYRKETKNISEAEYQQMRDLIYNEQREMIVGNALIAERMYFDKEDLKREDFDKKVKSYSDRDDVNDLDDKLYERFKNVEFIGEDQAEKNLEKLAKDTTLRTSVLYNEDNLMRQMISQQDKAEEVIKNSGKNIFNRNYKYTEPDFQIPVDKTDYAFFPNGQAPGMELLTRYNHRKAPLLLHDPFYGHSEMDIAYNDDGVKIVETDESAKRVNERILYFYKKLDDLNKQTKNSAPITLIDDVNAEKKPQQLEISSNDLNANVYPTLFKRTTESTIKPKVIDLRFLSKAEASELSLKAADPVKFMAQYNLVQEKVKLGESLTESYYVLIDQKHNDPFKKVEDIYSDFVDSELKKSIERGQTEFKLSELKLLHENALKVSSFNKVKDSAMESMAASIDGQKGRVQFYRRELRQSDSALVLQADTERFSPALINGALKTYSPDETKDYLKETLGNLKKLMATIDGWRDDMTAKDFVEESLFFNPSLASSLLAKYPEQAGLICKMYQESLSNKKVSKEKREKWHTILLWTAGIAVVAALVFLTAGWALPVLGGASASIGGVSVSFGGAITASFAVGTIASVGEIGLTAVDAVELNYEAQKIREHVKALGIGDQFEADQLMREAMKKYTEAAIWGTLTVVGWGSTKTAVRQLLKIRSKGELKKFVASSPREFGKIINESMKLKPVPGETLVRAVIKKSKAGGLTKKEAQTLKMSMYELRNHLKKKLKLDDDHIKKVTAEIYKTLYESGLGAFGSNKGNYLIKFLKSLEAKHFATSGAGNINDVLKFLKTAISEIKDPRSLSKLTTIMNDANLWQRIISYEDFIGKKYTKLFNYLIKDIDSLGPELKTVVHQRLSDLSAGIRRSAAENRQNLHLMNRYFEKLDTEVISLKNNPQKLKDSVLDAIDDYIKLIGTDKPIEFKDKMRVFLNQKSNEEFISFLENEFQKPSLKGLKIKDIIIKVYKNELGDTSVASMTLPNRFIEMKNNFSKNNKKFIEDFKTSLDKNCKKAVDVFKCIGDQSKVFYNRFIANNPCLKNNPKWAFFSFFGFAWYHTINGITHSSKILKDERYQFFSQLLEMDYESLSPVDREYFSILREKLLQDQISTSELQTLMGGREMGEVIEVNKLKSKTEIYQKSSEFMKERFGLEGKSLFNEYPIETVLNSSIWTRYWSELSCRMTFGGKVQVGERFHPYLITKSSKTFWETSGDFLKNSLGPTLVPTLTSTTGFTMMRASLIELEDREFKPSLLETAIDYGALLGYNLVWGNTKSLLMNTVNGKIIPNAVTKMASSMVNVPVQEQKKFIDGTTMVLQILADKGGEDLYSAWEYKMFSENVLHELYGVFSEMPVEEFPKKADIFLAIVTRMKIQAGHEVEKEMFEHYDMIQKQLLPFGIALEDFYLEKNDSGEMEINLDQNSIGRIIEQNHERITSTIEELDKD